MALTQEEAATLRMAKDNADVIIGRLDDAARLAAGGPNATAIVTLLDASKAELANLATYLGQAAPPAAPAGGDEGDGA